MTTPTDVSPAVVHLVAEIRRAVEAEVKSDVARRLADNNMGATEIAKLLGVSRNTVYRYLNRENGPPQAGAG